MNLLTFPNIVIAVSVIVGVGAAIIYAKKQDNKPTIIPGTRINPETGKKEYFEEKVEK